MKTTQSIRLYRFHDSIAIDGEDLSTFYLTPELARKFAQELNKYAEDCEEYGFARSVLGTKEIK